MDLLDRLIELEPYRHLNAIAYDAQTRFGLAKFVTVFNLNAILYDEISVIPPHTQLNIKLPS